MSTTTTIAATATADVDAECVEFGKVGVEMRLCIGVPGRSFIHEGGRPNLLLHLRVHLRSLLQDQFHLRPQGGQRIRSLLLLVRKIEDKGVLLSCAIDEEVDGILEAGEMGMGSVGERIKARERGRQPFIGRHGCH